MLKGKLLLGAVVTLMMAMTTAAVGPTSPLAREVRRELVMLPYYSVFDNLEFQVDGGKVVLMGRSRGRPSRRTLLVSSSALRE